jgi:hypothetical protein
MAHFAKLDNNNAVMSVHVVNNEELMVDGQEVESKGIEFLTDLHGHSNWKQTSYNGNFRKKYCSIGDIYNPTLDAFHAPKPYESWTLNEDTCQWEAPVEYPDATKSYNWDESTLSWIEV